MRNGTTNLLVEGKNELYTSLKIFACKIQDGFFQNPKIKTLSNSSTFFVSRLLWFMVMPLPRHRSFRQPDRPKDQPIP